MTGFTCEYLPLASYYSRVQKCMTGVTASTFNSSVIAHEQCIPRVVQAQHASDFQNLSRHVGLHTFFVNFDMSCTVATKVK